MSFVLNARNIFILKTNICSGERNNMNQVYKKKVFILKFDTVAEPAPFVSTANHHGLPLSDKKLTDSK